MKTGSHTIDNDKRRVVTKRGDTPDADITIPTGVTRGDNGNTGGATLQSFLTCSYRGLLHLSNIDHRYRTGNVFFPLGGVPCNNDLVQTRGLQFHANIDRVVAPYIY